MKAVRQMNQWSGVNMGVGMLGKEICSLCEAFFHIV